MKLKGSRNKGFTVFHTSAAVLTGRSTDSIFSTVKHLIVACHFLWLCEVDANVELNSAASQYYLLLAMIHAVGQLLW